MSIPNLRPLFLIVSFFLCFSCGFTERVGGDSAFLVRDIYPGSHSGAPDQMISVNNVVLFRAWYEPVGRSKLWKSDGTAQGTLILKMDDITSPQRFAKFGDLVVFGESRPWRSDGTEAGTFRISNAVGDPHSYTAAGGILFFEGGTSTWGYELWRSDGTSANTRMVKDINPGTADSYPGSLTNVNGVLFFRATDGVHGLELWKSDGTEAGTVLVKDINPGTYGSMNTSPYGTYAEFQGQFFFSATDGVHGQELWKSDGTEAGTVLVKDINPGIANAFPSQTGEFKKAGDKLFFRAVDGVHGMELWVTDGTEQGTHLVKDINPGSGNGYGYTLRPLRDFVCFNAYSPDYGYELWRTDGTEAGTYLIKDICPGPGSGWPMGTGCVCTQGRLYFDAEDGGAYGTELWTSDGTPEGTFRLTDINPGPGGSYPKYFAAANGLLLFQADDGVHGEELWAIPLLPYPKAPASAQSAWWRRY
jgi:ELWxxDGT repeat protein